MEKTCNVIPTLSLCMIVKDEESFLPMCLESVKDYVDEIIIVDTGSTDNTVEIARKYGANVYFHPWENSFSKARNYSLKYATCDWIIWLDADEEVDKEDAHKLRNVIKGPVGGTIDNRIDVIYLPLFSKHSGGNGLAVANIPKIFRNHLGFHFEGIVHNALKFSGNFKMVNIRAHHHGYNLDEGQMVKKFLRTSTLLKEQIKNNPDDPKPRQYLATAYSERKMYDECIEEALKAIGLYEKEVNCSPLLLLTYYTISVAYRCKDDLINAEKYSMRAIKAYPDYIDHYDMLSIIYFLQKDYGNFFYYTKKYLKILNKINKNPSIVLEVPYNTLKNDWLAYSRMSIIHYENGNEDGGVKELKNAIKHSENRGDPYLVIGKYFLEKKDFDRAASFFDEGIVISPGNKSILYYLADTYGRSGFPDKALLQLRKILGLYPDEILAQFRYGLISLNAGKFDDAIDSLKRVVNKEPEHISALFNLAVAYERMGDNIQAKGEYRDLLKIKPEYAEAHLRLGSLLLSESEYEKAKECFLSTLRSEKHLLESHLALSKIFILENDLEGCIKSCDELLKYLDISRDVTIDNVSDLGKLYVEIGKSLMGQQNETLAKFSFEISALLSPDLYTEDSGMKEVMMQSD